MNPAVESVKALAENKLVVLFVNGERKVFDVTPYLDRGIFVELKDESYFKSVRVAFGSIEWPNQQDFSRDTLYCAGETVGT